MNSNHTDITIVLDRSGSMQSVKSDTIGGFNQFLDDQRRAPGRASLTVHQFDDVFETLYTAQDIKLAPELTTLTFVPRANTALLDAIGRAINDTGKRLSTQPEADRPGHVVFVIMTDGYENASHEYDRAKVFEMITHQRERYHWQFVFIGADQDAIATASMMGIPTANAMTYAKNTAGTQAVFKSTSDNLVKMRCGQTSNMAYTNEDREEQRKAGV